MKSPLIVFFILLTTTFKMNAQTFEWTKTITPGESDWPEYIETDDSGNIYVVGSFEGTVDFDPGPGIHNISATSSSYRDFFVMKLDSNGDFVWAHGFGDGWSSAMAFCVKIDNNGNVLITGDFHGTVDFDPGPGVHNQTCIGLTNVFILKLDSNGDFIWVKTFNGVGGPGVEVSQTESLDIDSLDNVYITGTFQNSIDFDSGSGSVVLSSYNSLKDDFFITKLNSNGDYVWTKSLVGPDNAYHSNSISISPTQDLYITGSFLDTLNFGYGFNGIPPLINPSSYDVFLLKLSAAGSFIWTKSIGNTASITSEEVLVDNSQNVYITGGFNGTTDFDPGSGNTSFTAVGSASDIYIAKFDSSGTFLWAHGFSGTSSNEMGQTLAKDSSNNIYISGFFRGTVDFDPGPSTQSLTSSSVSGFVLKLDSYGNFLWTNKLFGLGGSTRVDGIDVDSNNNIYLAGFFQGNCDLDPTAITNFVSSGGIRDVFITKYDPCTESTVVDVISECESYTWIDGNTYTANNNTATHTLTNNAGCDSVVTLDLTITNSTSGTDVQSTCDSYTWIDGNTYTSSNNTATHTLTNAAGCDSVVALDLTITNSTFGTDVQSACNSYTWIDGNTYTASNNTATHTLTNAAGCDSVVTLDLTINSISDLSTSTSGVTITANNAGVSYQWLDCDDGYAVISGETGQSFTASVNGNYAVELTENECLDTSDCVSITTVGILENSFGNTFTVYPNPTNGNFSIDLAAVYENTHISITDISGRVIQSKTVTETQIIPLSIEESSGTYMVTIIAEDKKAVVRLIKE